MKRQSLAS
jgi:hypothetical protein